VKLADIQIEELRRDITTLLQIFKIENALGAMGASFDLNMTDLTVLVFVGENKQAKMTDLAHILNTRLSTVTSIIDRLIKQKLVLRKKSESDRRIIFVYLSAEGQRLHSGLVKEQFKNTVAMLSSLSPSDQVMISKIVKKIAESARAQFARLEP